MRKKNEIHFRRREQHKAHHKNLKRHLSYFVIVQTSLTVKVLKKSNFNWQYFIWKSFINHRPSAKPAARIITIFLIFSIFSRFSRLRLTTISIFDSNRKFALIIQWTSCWLSSRIFYLNVRILGEEQAVYHESCSQFTNSPILKWRLWKVENNSALL